MNITSVTGLTEMTIAILKALGAVESITSLKDDYMDRRGEKHKVAS
jgi:hypothetical protein